MDETVFATLENTGDSETLEQDINSSIDQNTSELSEDFAEETDFMRAKERTRQVFNQGSNVFSSMKSWCEIEDYIRRNVPLLGRLIKFLNFVG